MEKEYNMPGEKELLESVVKFISPRKVILKEGFYGGKDLHCGSCNNIRVRLLLQVLWSKIRANLLVIQSYDL